MTFQVEVNYVDVDTVVTDEQGTFISGLAAGRYLLRVEAQVRGNIENAKPASRETLITAVP